MSRADLLANVERADEARPAAPRSVVPDRESTATPWHGSAHAELARLERRARVAEERAAAAEALVVELRAELATLLTQARTAGRSAAGGSAG
jgi:hypothetical protein